MSRSIHITGKDFKGLTKKEIEEQYVDPDSDLATWSKKIGIKKRVKKVRKQNKDNKSAQSESEKK